MMYSKERCKRRLMKKCGLRDCYIDRHLYLIVLALTFAHPLHAQKVVFSAPGNNFGVWRLTHDPHIRDWSIQQIHKRVLQHIKTLSE